VGKAEMKIFFTGMHGDVSRGSISIAQGTLAMVLGMAELGSRPGSRVRVIFGFHPFHPRASLSFPSKFLAGIEWQ
jgi:hypothetical protein